MSSLPSNYEDVSYQEMSTRMPEFNAEQLRQWAMARISQLKSFSWEASQNEISDIRKWYRRVYGADLE
ncbi:MAG: hypothetical protein JO040_11970 [Gemmatimonadetes bacterium]|nr:hypothetical protein [Gemmatimonadota bacterium]